MFLVGDEVRHAAYLDALAGPHGYIGRVEAWYAGQLVGDVLFESGAVKVTARNRERRGLDLVVDAALWPALPADTLSPYGAWLRAYVTVTAGATSFPEIPVFAGKLHKVSRTRWDGKLSVTAVDPMWQVNREAIETPRPAPSGTPITTAIGLLLREVFAACSVLDLTGSTATVPRGIIWDASAGSRGKAIDELAQSIGAEVFALPVDVTPGGAFVIRPVPSLADPSVWTLPDLERSVVEGDQQTQSGEGVVNRWIVTAETPARTPIYETITDTNPASPTRYGGPMGRLPDFYTSALITSVGQAQAAGLAKLNRSLGLTRTRTITCIANAALEAGDVLLIAVEGEPIEVHIADDFDVPLTPDPAAMTIDTRSAEAAPA